MSCIHLKKGNHIHKTYGDLGAKAGRGRQGEVCAMKKGACRCCSGQGGSKRSQPNEIATVMANKRHCQVWAHTSTVPTQPASGPWRTVTLGAVLAAELSTHAAVVHPATPPGPGPAMAPPQTLKWLKVTPPTIDMGSTGERFQFFERHWATFKATTGITRDELK